MKLPLVVVAASGNREEDSDDSTFKGTPGNDANVYPADYPGVVAVSATPPGDEDPGTYVVPNLDTDVAAPTAGAISANATGQVCVVGEIATSWAAAEVSGILALLREQYPRETPKQLVARLQATTEGAGAPQGPDDVVESPWTGAGVVQAHDALTRQIKPGREGKIETTLAETRADAQAPPAPERVDLFSTPGRSCCGRAWSPGHCSRSPSCCARWSDADPCPPRPRDGIPHDRHLRRAGCRHPGRWPGFAALADQPGSSPQAVPARRPRPPAADRHHRAARRDRRPSRIHVSTRARFAEAARATLGPVPPENLILEEDPAGPATAFALSIATLAHRYGNAPALIAPSDHLINEEAAFNQASRDMLGQLVESPDSMVVLGAEPTGFDGSLGYIHTQGEDDAVRGHRPASSRSPTSRGRRDRGEGSLYWNTACYGVRVQEAATPTGARCR